MKIVYEASRYNPNYQLESFDQVGDAIAFAEVGEGGTVTKVVDGRTAAGWVFDGEWFSIDILFTGKRVDQDCPH